MQGMEWLERGDGQTSPGIGAPLLFVYYRGGTVLNKYFSHEYHHDVIKSKYVSFGLGHRALLAKSAIFWN